MGIVDSMQWLIGINAMVWTGTLAILGLLFAFTFGYQLAVQYQVGAGDWRDCGTRRIHHEFTAEFHSRFRQCTW